MSTDSLRDIPFQCASDNDWKRGEKKVIGHIKNAVIEASTCPMIERGEEEKGEYEKEGFEEEPEDDGTNEI